MKLLRILAYASVAPLVALGSPAIAQDNPTTSVLDRYGNLNVERSGPTIDADLARRMYRRGNTYSNLERYEEAITEYRKAINADPNFADAFRNLANIYYFLGRHDEAKPMLARFIALSEQPTASLLAALETLGELERRDGNFEQSLPYDLRAIELDPQNDSQVHIMANTYNNAGDAEKAIAVYRAGIAAQPGNGFFDRSLGRLLEQEGRLDEALLAYEEAARKDPESDFYANLVESTRRRLAR